MFNSSLRVPFSSKKSLRIKIHYFYSLIFFLFVLFLRLKCPYETAVELAALCLQGMQSFLSDLSLRILKHSPTGVLFSLCY